MTRRAWALAVSVAALAAVTPARGAAQETAAPRPTVGILRMPPPVAARAARMRLTNGVHLTMLQVGDAPKTLVRVVIEMGVATERGCQMPAILAAVFQNGTAALEGQGLSDSVADMGGTWGVVPQPERLSLTLDVLSTFADAAIGLVGDIVRHPHLDSSAVHRRLDEAATVLAATRSNIDSVALHQFTATVFPNGQFGAACAPTPTPTPTPRGDQYAAAAVERYYSARVTPRRTSVYVVGRFDTASVRRAVVTAFGGWSASSETSPSTPARVVPQPALSIVDRPGSKQVALVVGAAVAGARSPAFPSTRVADAMLGGSLVSRITENIREAKGYAYSPISQVVTAPSGEAYWAEITNVAAPVAWPALREILREIARLGHEAPSPDEVTGTQRYMVGRILIQRAARAGWADELELRGAVTGRDQPAAGADPRLLAVTGRDVQRLVGAKLPATGLTIVVVGDTTAMGAQMADLRRGVQAARLLSPQ